MESKENQTETSNNQAPNINIDIHGDGQDENGVKNMNLDSSSRAGLSKEELMKYANQPFWVRLRNILFATFWLVWFSILVAAIGYVVNSPNCVKLASASPMAAANQTAAAGEAVSSNS